MENNREVDDDSLITYRRERSLEIPTTAAKMREQQLEQISDDLLLHSRQHDLKLN